MSNIRPIIKSVVSALVAVALLAVPAPANARPPDDGWRDVSATSTQEGCHLTVTAIYRRADGSVILDSVLATGLNGWSVGLGVTDAAGKLVYSGPTSHGKVGDGVDYLWVKGTELNADGEQVPIGASDLNPQGWPRAGYRSSTFNLTVSAPEFRYCGVTLSVA